MHIQRVPDGGRTPDRPGRPATTGRAPLVRAPSPGRALTPAQILAVRGAAGNAAVVQRIAEDEERHQHDAGCGHAPSVQRSSVPQVISRPGARFDGPVRKEAESVYGVDLSHLRVHTDAQARQSAQEVGAEAYTSGHHMVFNGPMTKAKVLHEVAHTFQQAAGSVSGRDHGDGVSVSDPNSPEERQAAAMENASAPSAGLQRLVSAVSPAPHPAPEGAEAPVQRMPQRRGDGAAGTAVRAAPARGASGERGRADSPDGASRPVRETPEPLVGDAGPSGPPRSASRRGSFPRRGGDPTTLDMEPPEARYSARHQRAVGGRHHAR